MEIEVRGFKELHDKLERLASTVSVAEAVQAGAFILEGTIKQRCPVDTGNLRNSIHPTVKQATRTQAEATVSTSVEYAAAVEYGTGPHVIRPRNKRALSWPGADHPVAYVNHPGTAAQPYMRPGFDDGKEAATQAVVATLQRQFADLTR